MAISRPLFCLNVHVVYTNWDVRLRNKILFTPSISECCKYGNHVLHTSVSASDMVFVRTASTNDVFFLALGVSLSWFW